MWSGSYFLTRGIFATWNLQSRATFLWDSLALWRNRGKKKKKSQNQTKQKKPNPTPQKPTTQLVNCFTFRKRGKVGMEFFLQRDEECNLWGLLLWLCSVCSARCLGIKLEQNLSLWWWCKKLTLYRWKSHQYLFWFVSISMLSYFSFTYF